MYDPFLEEDPWVKEKVAEGMAKGEALGEACGELRQAQETVIRFVQRRFPTLGELVRAQMHQATQTRAVNALME